ncbi:hypothetical protein HMPREF9207_0024 [Cutibacterium acnes J165]|nr:hypothetical protein HMPREF9207_0024 [Cutibacterium acnes J165]
MYAMQYQITLPTDYDMQIIRDRVIQTGHLMDGYHGLEFKAYLIQEKVKRRTPELLRALLRLARHRGDAPVLLGRTWLLGYRTRLRPAPDPGLDRPPAC